MPSPKPHRKVRLDWELTGQGDQLYRLVSLLGSVTRSTQSTRLGYESPFIKPFLNKTKQNKFTKEKKRYRKRITCFICPKKRKKKKKGTMPTCSTIKGSLFLFFNTKYKQRIHILKTELRSRHAVLEILQ